VDEGTVPLKPGAGPPDGFARRTSARRQSPVLPALAIGVPSALALFVLWFLPDYMAPQKGVTAAPTPESAQPAPAATAAVENESDRAEAERLQAEALRRLARLENEGGRIWGAEPMAGVGIADAEEVLRMANTAHERRLHAEASRLFGNATAMLDQILASKPERLRLVLAQGRAALDAQDVASAIRHFEIAAALAPGDPAVTESLARARRLPEVLAKIAVGRTAESAGDLEQARNGYREALALEPSSEVGRESLARVERQIMANAYRGAISEAFAQLHKGDRHAAQAALDRAQRIDPKAPEIAEIRQRLQSASKTAAMQRLRTQIDGLERQEKWAEAVKSYDQALSLDPAAAFASTGRQRAQLLSTLHAALDTYIAQPERLTSSSPLAHAKSLLTVEDPAGAGGQQLATKKKRLAELIALAQIPIPVMFRSDSNTEVTINRVAKLGAFNARHVELPPGKYVAVGSRTGYRDVRVSFEVSANAANQPVIIQCTEPIQ
jgi:tetratricopeptide (TPR) repeat protein